MSETSGKGDGGRTAVDVEIMGERYTIRADADEEYTKRCAALVDERMRAISQVGPSTRKTAIMAALSLSDDLFRQRERVDERARALAGRLRSVLDD